MRRAERNRVLWVVVGVVLLFALAWPMLAGAGMGYGVGGGPGWAGWPGPRPFGGGWLVGLALVAAGVVLLAGRGRGRRGWAPAAQAPMDAAPPPPPASAEELLRWRYASGELSREQYQEMLATLRAGSSEPA
jgi:uncharacterized membrane protein